MSLLTSHRSGTAGEPAVPRCGLQDTVGRVEACAGACCPFWDEDAASGGGCAIERLVARIEWSPELAHFLLALRRQLELARDGRAADAGWNLWQRIGDDRRPPR